MKSPQSADITPNARNPKLASETSKQTRAFALHPPSNSLGGLEQGGWALRKQSDRNAGPFREETEPPLLSHSCSHPGDPSRPSAQHHRDSTRAFGTQEQEARGQPRRPAGNRNSRARHSPPTGARAAAGSQVREGRCFRKEPKKSHAPGKRRGSLGHAASLIPA